MPQPRPDPIKLHIKRGDTFEVVLRADFAAPVQQMSVSAELRPRAQRRDRQPLVCRVFTSLPAAEVLISVSAAPGETAKWLSRHYSLDVRFSADGAAWSTADFDIDIADSGAPPQITTSHS